uniref:Uncharacterized protein n=1 Tax=Chenopodium quinoa TaxID=63459 RepID=A0A803LK89_CHEQI
MEGDSSTYPIREDIEGGGKRIGCGGCLKMKLPNVPIKNIWKKGKNYIKQTSKSCSNAVAATNVCIPQPKKALFHDDFRYAVSSGYKQIGALNNL